MEKKLSSNFLAETEKIICLQPNWPAPSIIKAYTTTRVGGYSKGNYASFNLGANVDDATTVNKNRAKLKKELNLPNEPFWLTQVHGTHVLRISQDHDDISSTRKADASYTTTPNTVCVVLTADCLPLLICNKKGTHVAAIHAGWKGLAAGIIGATLAKLNLPGKDLLVWLGPALGPRKFVVGDDVREQFVSKNSQSDTHFSKQSNNSWLMGIYGLARQQLNDYHVTAIYGGDYCTYTEKDLFFSYRRDNGQSGRMASLIYLTSHNNSRLQQNRATLGLLKKRETLT